MSIEEAVAGGERGEQRRLVLGVSASRKASAASSAARVAWWTGATGAPDERLHPCVAGCGVGGIALFIRRARSACASRRCRRIGCCGVGLHGRRIGCRPAPAAHLWLDDGDRTDDHSGNGEDGGGQSRASGAALSTRVVGRLTVVQPPAASTNSARRREASSAAASIEPRFEAHPTGKVVLVAPPASHRAQPIAAPGRAIRSTCSSAIHSLSRGHARSNASWTTVT